MFDFIRTDSSLQISFSEAEVYNVLGTICLLIQDVEGLDSWIRDIKLSLTEQQLAETKNACRTMSLVGDFNGTFEQWLKELNSAGEKELLDREYASLERMMPSYFGDKEMLPSRDTIFSDFSVYSAFRQSLAEEKEHPSTEEEIREDFAFYSNMAESIGKVVSHLEYLWSTWFKSAWHQDQKLISDSISALSEVSYDGLSPSQVLKKVTERNNLPEPWTEWFDDITSITFIPNMHIGPYLLLIDKTSSHVKMLFHAHRPEGSRLQSPELDRSELLMRLSALSDNSRLQIIELAQQKGKITAQDVMDSLGLSQSSASRHLGQLSATGFLGVETKERTKYFFLQKEKVKNIMDSVSRYFGGSE